MSKCYVQAYFICYRGVRIVMRREIGSLSAGGEVCVCCREG